MRQEKNNEIDLLLRRLSRRDGAPMSGADSHLDSDHLDADELSSYAENVLPAAARARYTEHLAECSRCRELVVQLSASVPLVARKETLTVVDASGLRKFLASLISPMALRYAVPALALIVAAAIGIVVLRSNRSPEFVAQLKQDRPSQSAAPVPNAQQAPEATADKQAPTESPAQARAPETHAYRGKETEPAPPSNTAPAATGARAEPQTNAPVQKTEEQPKPTATPPPAAPKPAETVEQMRVEVDARKTQAAGGTVAPASGVAREKSTEGFSDAEKKSGDAAASRGAAKLRRAESTAQPGADTSNFRVAEQEKDRADGVIRNVGGRRFRKQGGVWVDTAYNSDSAIVNVARGSEQYRALVADEPTIKTIADQLDGPLIVVWKGRTYRIR